MKDIDLVVLDNCNISAGEFERMLQNKILFGKRYDLMRLITDPISCDC